MKRLKIVFGSLILLNIKSTFAQHDSLKIKNKSNEILFYTALTTGLATSHVGLNELWYKDYPKTTFHFFNDNKEWFQMDKTGHLYSSFQLTRLFIHANPTYSNNPKRAKIIGSSFAFSYMLSIEILDSKSAQWGFSKIDFFANSVGVFLASIYDYPRIKNNFQFKFSYQNSPYAAMRPNTLGRNFQQRLFKDYNAQTYWLSAHIFPKHRRSNTFKSIIELSFGYGIDEMLYADNNINSVNNFHARREFFLSFDADLNQIKWKRNWMKKLVKIFNVIKVPSPTIQIQSNGKVKLLPLYF
jgi:hypothetical protein